jgi:hypothetical protein
LDVFVRLVSHFFGILVGNVFNQRLYCCTYIYIERAACNIPSTCYNTDHALVGWIVLPVKDLQLNKKTKRSLANSPTIGLSSCQFPFLFKYNWMQRGTICHGLSVLEIISSNKGTDESLPAKSVLEKKSNNLFCPLL